MLGVKFTHKMALKISFEMNILQSVLLNNQLPPRNRYKRHQFVVTSLQCKPALKRDVI